MKTKCYCYHVIFEKSKIWMRYYLKIKLQINGSWLRMVQFMWFIYYNGSGKVFTQKNSQIEFWILRNSGPVEFCAKLPLYSQRQLRTPFGQTVLLLCNGYVHALLLSCRVEYRLLVKGTFIIFSIFNDFSHGITHPKLKNSRRYKTNTLFSLI